MSFIHPLDRAGSTPVDPQPHLALQQPLVEQLQISRQAGHLGHTHSHTTRGMQAVSQPIGVLLLVMLSPAVERSAVVIAEAVRIDAAGWRWLVGAGGRVLEYLEQILAVPAPRC